jgi:hypothetical protein
MLTRRRVHIKEKGSLIKGNEGKARGKSQKVCKNSIVDERSTRATDSSKRVELIKNTESYLFQGNSRRSSRLKGLIQ